MLAKNGSENPQSPQIVSIQWLRALAALAVVLWHAEGRWRDFTGSGPAVHSFGGQAGVDLFFLISGFVMWLTVAGRPMTMVEFLRRRITRIVPLYWFYTSVLVFGALLLPSAFPNVVLAPYHVLASYLFIPATRPDSGFAWPVLGQGWTLNYEMLFYLIFAFTLFALSRSRQRLVALTVVLGGLVLVGLLAQPQGTIAAAYTSPLLLEFLFGVWIAAAWQAGRIGLSPGLSAGTMSVGLAVIVISGYYTWPEPLRAVLWGLPSAAILVAGLSLNRYLSEKPSIASLLGDASYSIYLSHGFTIAALHKLIAAFGITQPSALPLFVGAAIVASSIVGYASYILLEKPVIEWTRHRGLARSAKLRSAP